MAPSEQVIVERLGQVLRDMVVDWEPDFDSPVGRETRIVDELGFESVDLMQLIVEIEKAFDCRGLPFDQVFMADSGYATEITVGQLADFLSAHL